MLERYSQQNLGSAPARLDLAYLYMTQGSTDAAVQQLKRVAALQPKDTLAPQLIQRLGGTSAPAAGSTTGQPSQPPQPGVRTSILGTATPTAAVKPGKLEGAWAAHPDPQTTITLSFLEGGRFTWKVAHQGQDRLIQGKVTSGNDLLTLAQDHGVPIVGNLNWADETHFNFKVAGGGPDDQGLSFSKSQ